MAGIQCWAVFEYMLMGTPETQNVLQVIIEWVCQLHKTRDMSVQKFVSSFEELNSFLKYCLNISSTNPVPSDDAKECIFLKKACPGAWEDEMTK
eukprot:11949283-Ditylum_brightwellii.AAC.1